ncbi:MAG: TraB/GumN family protein [Novosphingobium sp.]
MKFRKLILAPLVAACALLGPASLAQQQLPTPQKVQPAPAPILAHPALWKVSDADTTIYLFGTIHLLPKGIEWYDGALANAFEGSQELVTEIPEIPDGESIAMMLKHGTQPAGQTLRLGMSETEKGKYEAAMTSVGLPPAAFDRYKPWFAAVVLATLPLQKKGYSLENGIESQLDKRNKALGRTRSGLETLDYQLGLFDGLGQDAQKAYLFAVIDAMPSIADEIDKMVGAWTKGDADALADALNSESDDPALYETLITNRNRNWAGWVSKRLDQPGTVFVAVGAGHLGGKGSVQDFLAQRGIKAVRVQ